MNPYANITGRDFTEDHQELNKSVAPTTHRRYEKYMVKPDTKAPIERIPRKSVAEEPPKPLRASRITPLRLLIGFVCLTFLMILWVWETTYVREGLREIEKLKDQKLAVEKTNEAIRTDITRLSGYQRIEKIAAEHLRMVRAKDKPGVILISADEARIIKESQPGK